MWQKYGYKSYASQRERQSGTHFSWWSRLFGGQRNKRNFKTTDYLVKSFRNPYFAKNRMPRRTRAPKTKLLIGALSLLSIAGIFLFHPFFNITVLSFTGLQRIPYAEAKQLVTDALNQKKWFFFNNQNYFLTNLGAIERALREKYSINQLSLKKHLPRTITINLKEKEISLLLQLNCETGKQGDKILPTKQYFWIDEDGNVSQQVTAEAAGQIGLTERPPWLIKNDCLEPLIGEGIINKAALEFTLYLFDNVAKQAKIPITAVEMADNDGRVLNLVTVEGWKVIVDRQNDWGKQINVLTVILRDKIKEKRAGLQYIDVRYENRSYFQYKK